MDQIEQIEIKSKISDIKYINYTTCILVINIDKDLCFNAGQYAMLKFKGHDYKPFSIASISNQKKLEFHIKNSGYGIGEFILNNLKINDEISIKLPFGTAYLQNNSKPILAIAGGVGIGQIGSIVNSALNNGRDIKLFYGAIDLENLYMFEYYNKISKNNFGFTPIIETSENKDYIIGIVGDIAVKEIDNLNDHDIYISGPPEMVIYTVNLLIDNSVNTGNIYCDLPIEFCLKD